ncbi:hypothetical protein LCGC14_0477150 [marine sediment metagenome]|uniref:Uncharacterized protein n=1 Tax=marine sediment metagenome TaxID=412755 RepID=A0A0F9VJ97_9ZZZZ
MPLPRIPTFDELLKRVKEPKVPEVEELKVEVAPEFRNLPPGWSVRQTPFGDSLVSPRGLTFSDIKLEGGKITDFQVFRGDRPVRLPQPIAPVEPPPEPPVEPEFKGIAPLPSLRPFAPRVEPSLKQREPELNESEAIRAKIADPNFTGDRIELGLRLIDLETKRAGQTEISPIQKQLRSEEGISSQEFESLAGMTLQEYSVALLEGRVERISQPGERLEGFETPEGERRVRIEDAGKGLSLFEKIFRFQTGDLPVEALPEPVRTLGKVGKGAIAAAGAPLFTVAGVPVSAGDIVALALLGYGVYAGVRSLIPLFNKVKDKALQTALNTGLDRWIARMSRGIPPQHFKDAQNSLYNVIARDRIWLQQKATENMLRNMGRGINQPQAANQAVQDTIRDFETRFGGLIPRATQTGALAQGGLAAGEGPTIQSVVAKIAANQPLTAAERQFYASESQAVEQALQAQVPTEVTPEPTAVPPAVPPTVPPTAVTPEVPVVSEVGATRSLKTINADIEKIQDTIKFFQKGRPSESDRRQIVELRKELEALFTKAKAITTPPTPTVTKAPLTGALVAEGESLIAQAEALAPTNASVIKFRELVNQAKEATTPEAQRQALIQMEALEDEIKALVPKVPAVPEAKVGFQVDVTDVAKGYEPSLVKVGDSVRLVGEKVDVGFPHKVLDTRIVPDITEPQLLLTTKSGNRWVTGPFAELSKAVTKPPTVTKPPVEVAPEAPQAITKPVTEEVVPAEPTRAEIAKLAEQVKAKLPAEPPKPKSPVERRTEIQSLLKEPAKNLPKGTTKIELRKELAQINKALIPQEKKLRSQIMATVKGKSLGTTQSRNIFREVGGSRYLTNLEFTQLEKVLKAVQRARPIRIKGKLVITPKNEALIQSAKKDLIDQGILTEATYKDILESLKLSTDKYVDSQNFITNSQGGDIIRNMRNIAILNPLGELKFGKPTAVKFLTSQVYYAQVLGLKPLTNPLELAKVDFDLAYRAMSNAVDAKLREVNKAWGVSSKEIIESKAKNIPTKGSSALRDLLDKTEEPPAGLTPKQEELFTWFRNLNRSIINGENEVRRAMGVEEISYRQAYVRHVPDEMARNIIEGTHPIPPSLQYWAKKLVSKKVFNPMELHRQLSDDLAKLYSKDLAFATKNMVYTGLKEIHLAQPLRAFTERMGALTDIMPASTRKWVTDYINQVIKGQQTEWDESINAIVTESGIGGVIDTFLKPFNRTLGQRPVTRLAQTIGNMTIYSVLGLPRPRLIRLMIRNVFQRTQELALHGVVPTLKSFLPDPKALKELKSKSRYLKSYTGIEEWPTDLLGKLGKIPLAPYQFTATLNADRGMSTAYHDYGKFITDKKYKDMVGRTGKRWASEKRTYTEEKGFLYPEEQKILLEEMELATRATQYQYIGMGMPEIFRHKTLIPFTRLQSWWMNHFTMFHREAFHRFAYGETMSGYPLPWSSRVNWLKYLLLGGAILTSMGYTASYLIKVLPHNESPFAQFAIGLFKYVSATSDWTRAQAKWDMQSSWKAMVPGAMAADEIQKLWTGEMPIWQALFYGREEEGPPLHIPDYGFPIEESGLKKAETAITESISKLGQQDDVSREEAIAIATEAGASKAKLKEINAKDWTYDITSLRRDIGDATRNLDEDDIAELEPIAGNYVEFKAQDKAYELLGDKEQEQYIEDNPEYMTNRLFWGELTTISDLKTAEALVVQAQKYNIPLNMIPAFQLTDKGNERIPSNRNLWRTYFDYYDLPGTSYLNMTQAQVDAGQLPEKYRSEWEAYQKLKTDTAKGFYRKAHREAAYSKWRVDFRRANAEFDQWLVDQEYNKPLPKKAISRTARGRITLPGVFSSAGGRARPRRTRVSFPKFKRPRISRGISIRAPSAPGV